MYIHHDMYITKNEQKQHKKSLPIFIPVYSRWNIFLSTKKNSMDTFMYTYFKSIG